MSFFWSENTKAANTPITEIAPPIANMRPRITALNYTAGTTGHNIRLLRTLAVTTLTANKASGTAVINLSSAAFLADTVLANDWLIVQHGDKSFGIYKVQSVANVVDITLTANLTKDVVSGGAVYIMGAETDTPHGLIKVPASTTKEFQNLNFEGGFDIGTFKRDGYSEPLMLHIDNITVAGTLNWGSGLHISL